ncbi:MAG TPA: type I methionyl aminopeptidase [Anaerolineae bacterium]|nr:type I methionyl aminopeptidase [Anaerolineae bacterium]
MPVDIKSKKELDLMRAAGKIVAEILVDLQEHAKAGVSTAELDRRARSILEKYGATSPFLGYPNVKKNDPKFPAWICTSINDEIVHGIPKPNRILRDGDLLKIDVGANYAGYIGDSAWTFPIGNVSDKAKQLMRVSEESLMQGIAQVHAGRHLWDVIRTIQNEVESHGFNVVREYQGHGVGRDMHEEPSIPNFLDDEFEKRPTNITLKPGMTLAIEPMVVTGKWQTRTLGDKWTVVTKDHGLAAHYEHTVAVTDNGPEILTLWK